MKYMVILSIILSVIFLFASIEAQTVTVYIEINKMKVSPGETFLANVIIDPAEKGISAVDVILSFNPEVLEALNISKGRLLGENVIELFSEINNTAGIIHYVAARVGATTPPTPKEILASIVFRVKQNAKPINTTISIARIGIADERIADIEYINTKNVTISIARPTIVTTSPTTVITISTSFSSYFPTTTPIIITEGRETVSLVILLSMLLIIISILAISILLLTASKRKRRKPIVVGVE
ncbi:MAG: cohesin domain-containing protein [Ignisphaera sp.]